MDNKQKEITPIQIDYKKLFFEYREYVSRQLLLKFEILNFTEWRKQNGNS